MLNRKAWLLVIFLVLLIDFPCLVFACSGKVIGIAGGDTIAVLRDKEQVRIRLYGIDTPERGQAFSKKAKQFTYELVYGKVVEVGAIKVDHYGRTVSLVYVEGKGVCDELIRAGLAWVYYLYCNLPNPCAHQALHDKQNGLEIWYAIIGGHSGNGSRRLGGLGGGRKSGLAGIFFRTHVAA